METLIHWIGSHAEHAHWVIFIAILLAGMNVPISVDILMICAALLAATVMPEHTIHLFLAMFLGCYFSAWIAYWIGRLAGNRLLQVSWFSKLLTAKRINHMRQFIEKYGFFTLLAGRFIPFGVRNCIFLTSGLSRMNFLRFACYDFIACFVWTSCMFYGIYSLGKNYDSVLASFKIFNLFIFAAFNVTLIALIWYKRKKKILTEARESNVNLVE